MAVPSTKTVPKTRYKGQTMHWYPITLECTGDRIVLDRPDSVMPAWTRAQRVAQFLGVELIDESDMEPA